MSYSASNLLRRVTDQLVDPASTRWQIDELVRYLNDGQREIIVHRPDAISTTGSIALTSGASRQSLPAGAVKLGRLLRNTAGTKRAIDMVSREALDQQLPGWQGYTASNEITSGVYDPLEPLVFHVFPPASTEASVEAFYFIGPTDIAAPTPGQTYANVVGNISVPDTMANALIDYILYRAFGKEDQETLDLTKSGAHYAAFKASLGIDAQTTMLVTPKPAVSKQAGR